MSGYREIKFKCPVCGGDKIERLLAGADVYSPVLSVDPDSTGGFADVEYDAPSDIADGEVCGFCCSRCWSTVGDGTEEGLVEALLANGWLGDPVEPLAHAGCTHWERPARDNGYSTEPPFGEGDAGIQMADVNDGEGALLCRVRIDGPFGDELLKELVRACSEFLSERAAP